MVREAKSIFANALSFISTGDGVKFAARHFAFFRIEVGGDGIYTIGIADHDNLVGELFQFQMQVKATAIGIDDKFRRSDHCLSLLMVSKAHLTVWRLLRACQCLPRYSSSYNNP